MQQRTDRVASLLLREVSQALREDIQDPNVGFVTFLRADVSKDLRNSRVYYSVLGTDEDKMRTDLAIQKSAREIKRLVNDRIQLRYAIDIRFVREDGLDNTFRVEELLNTIRQEREAKGIDEGDSPESRSGKETPEDPDQPAA
ncbi:MAG: 30S ribosome-binding factor RbfA [Candidatus Omnitrophica bacterium]|jgi:ribosome-binding factor A|nr:30S ribosome-binding factor RbfA [Candidatus Omnitrophota bacterium]